MNKGSKWIKFADLPKGTLWLFMQRGRCITFTHYLNILAPSSSSSFLLMCQPSFFRCGRSLSRKTNERTRVVKSRFGNVLICGDKQKIIGQGLAQEATTTDSCFVFPTRSVWPIFHACVLKVCLQALLGLLNQIAFISTRQILLIIIQPELIVAN